MKKKNGFTLIELLIVVAIIGILAAIAVPNFLNAQMRARLARVQADLRSISTGLEMYSMDYGTYPTDAGRGYIGYTNPDGLRTGWIPITTPIAYINGSSLIDPFKAKYVEVDGTDRQFGDALYEMGAGNYNPDKFNNFPFVTWILLSIGPDSTLGREHADDTSLMANYPFSDAMFRFDATNGLTSNGDIQVFKEGQPASTVQNVDGRPWPHS
jgi:type II secretion system protein G